MADDKLMRAQRAEKAWRKKMKAEPLKCSVCGMKAPEHSILCPNVFVIKERFQNAGL